MTGLRMVAMLDIRTTTGLYYYIYDLILNMPNL